MRMSIADLVFYAEFSPPAANELHANYTKRRVKAWADCLVSYDAEDRDAFHEVAGQLYFAKDKKGPGVRLSGAELIRKQIAEDRERLQAAPIHYARSFDAHIFAGEPDGNKHKGLHSLNLLLGTVDAPALAIIVRDASTGAYAAWATLRGKSERKASSFFPDAWAPEKVKAIIKEAYIDARLNPSFSRSQASAHGLSWVGRANVSGSQMMVGGLGDAEKPASGMATAFPAVNGEFKDYN